MKFKPISIRKLLFLSLGAILMVSLFVGPALAVSGNLPGGTAIEVVNEEPIDGAVFYVGVGNTLDIDDSGSASVAEGIPLKDTTVVYVMDRSGSMATDAGVDCDGVSGTDTRSVCAQIGVAEANEAAADYYSAVGLSGIASFQSEGAGASHDVDLGSSGTQLLVAPDYDGNSNGDPDVEDVAYSLSYVSGAQTDFADGLQKAVNIINDASNTNSVNIILFLSDADVGSVYVGNHVNTVTIPAGTTIHTFGLGSGPSCSYDGTTGSLNDIAGMSTAGTGTCQIVSDMSELANFITESLGSTLDSLEIEVDSGGATPIPNADIDPDLPQDGPATVDYDTQVTGLGAGTHDICVTAYGTDAGGEGSVTDCKEIKVIEALEVSKDWRYTNVCFEVDNDRDGKLSEDWKDGEDNDQDGAIDEDPDECDETYAGDLLPMEDHQYVLEAVVSQNGMIKNTNPGQFYAVSTVKLLVDVDALTIVEDFGLCVDAGLCQLNPKKGGGKVVVVDANGSDLVQTLDAMDPEVKVADDGRSATVELGPMAAGTYMVYVKFELGSLDGQTVKLPIRCENLNLAKVFVEGQSVPDEASAILMLIEKVGDD